MYYYPNRRYKPYITSLKAVIVGKSLISAGLDIDRILHFVFMIKYSKYTDNIGSGNFTDTFCQNIGKCQKSGKGCYPAPPAPSHAPHPPHAPLETPSNIAYALDL